jgi:serine/threonine/tyrosine-interacting protein
MIHVPIQHYGVERHSIMPSYRPVNFSQLSDDEFAIITGNRTQTAYYRERWPYERRRDAQAVLDFLYLGPTSVIRDEEYLQREDFSMIIIIRDARAPRDYPSARAACSRLGISQVYIDANPDYLVQSFYKMANQVNSHLLTVNDPQMSGSDDASECIQRPMGKVLVTCDSGNDLSPTLVASYLMLMYGMSMESGFGFVIMQRFCCVFDGRSKEALRTWQELIEANAAVASHSQHHTAATGLAILSKADEHTKRRLDAMLYEEGSHVDFIAAGDCERFDGRPTFVPFMELDG